MTVIRLANAWTFRNESMHHFFAKFLFLIAGIALLATPSMAAPEVRIGWSVVDITPDGPVKMRGNLFSTGVMDPVTATILALESGDGEQAVMISCDLLRITDGNRYAANMRDKVRGLVMAQVPELRGEQIVLMATHTHVAPSVTASPEYNEFASERIANAVVEAWKVRKVGGVSFGLGHAVVGHNRIATYADGTSHMSGSFQKGSTSNEDFRHIEGFEDHSVNLLYTWDRQKKLTGVIVNLACPAQVQRGDKLSADYWHEVRELLAKDLGAEVHVLPQLSAAGDIATTVMVERKAEKRMQELRFPDAGDERLQRRMQIARRIAATVVDVLPVAKLEIDTAPLLMHSMARLDLRLGFPEAAPDAAVFPIEVHAIRLGDVAFVTNPFELYLDYGTRIKGRSPAVQTFVAQLAGSASYLPTERAVRHGGYGAIEKTCVVGPAAGEQIVSASLELLQSLWEADAE